MLLNCTFIFAFEGLTGDGFTGRWCPVPCRILRIGNCYRAPCFLEEAPSPAEAFYSVVRVVADVCFSGFDCDCERFLCRPYGQRPKRGDIGCAVGQHRVGLGQGPDTDAVQPWRGGHILSTGRKIRPDAARRFRACGQRHGGGPDRLGTSDQL